MEGTAAKKRELFQQIKRDSTPQRKVKVNLCNATGGEEKRGWETGEIGAIFSLGRSVKTTGMKG